MKLLPVFKDSNGDYECFKAVVNASDMLNGIDNEVSLDDDEASELVQSLWLEIASTTTNREDGLFSFIEYLYLMKSKAKGFKYKIGECSSNFLKPGKKLLGVICQTAMIEGILSSFVISFALIWWNEESIYYTLAIFFSCHVWWNVILCGEQEDMDQFGWDFPGAASLRCPLSEVKVVVGDEFFTKILSISLDSLMQYIWQINGTYLILATKKVWQEGLWIVERSFGKTCQSRVKSRIWFNNWFIHV